MQCALSVHSAVELRAELERRADVRVGMMRGLEGVFEDARSVYFKVWMSGSMFPFLGMQVALQSVTCA